MGHHVSHSHHHSSHHHSSHRGSAGSSKPLTRDQVLSNWPCQILCAFSWPLLLFATVVLILYPIITAKDLPIESYPGYNLNAELQKLLNTSFFPQQITFEYKQFGLDSNKFMPSNPDYDFYSCDKMRFFSDSSYTMDKSFTWTNNGGNCPTLSANSNIICDGNAIVGTICPLYTKNMTVLPSAPITITYDKTDYTYRVQHTKYTDYNCLKINGSGFSSSSETPYIVGFPRNSPKTNSPVKLQLRYKIEIQFTFFIGASFTIVFCFVVLMNMCQAASLGNDLLKFVWCPCFVSKTTVKALRFGSLQILQPQNTAVLQTAQQVPPTLNKRLKIEADIEVKQMPVAPQQPYQIPFQQIPIRINIPQMI